MGRHRADERTDVFRLFFVCTATLPLPVRRDPDRHLLRRRLGGRAAASFRSPARVHAIVGSAMYADSRAELGPSSLDGAPADGFVARQLQSSMIEQSHLVLGATSRHRSAVVEQCPAALPITFGLREFARLSAAVDPAELPTHPVARAHALVELSRLRRGLVPPDPDVDDIPDPIGGPRAAHHRAARLIHATVADVVDVVSPPTNRAR